MRLLRYAACCRRTRRRGAALLLSLLVLLVLIAIVIEINVSTGTDARIARNDIGITSMDLAAESYLLDVYDRLKMDGAAGGGEAPTGDPTTTGAPGTGSPGGTGGAGESGAASDSRRDEWATPRRDELNEIRLRVITQDEDSKINVLGMLSEDEDEARAAHDRVVRCLDFCREGTEADIDPHTAEAMANAMLEYMKQRSASKVPRSAMLSDDEKNEDRYLPTSLREFAVLPPFDESYFRDFADENGVAVHSIGSFLTVWSSLTTRAEATTSGGGPGASASTSGGAPPATQPAAAAAAATRPGGRNGSGGSNGARTGTATASGGPPAAGQEGAAGGGPAAATGAPGAAGAEPAAGGYAVNVNTAPAAVLKALFDDRVVPLRFWDKVIEYRNLEEEEDRDKKSTEDAPPVDEYGNEIIKRRIFESLNELTEVDGFLELEPARQKDVNALLTTTSHVFSVFVVAHRSTSSEGEMDGFSGGSEERREPERSDALVRIIRSVVWRKEVEGEMQIVPIVRWEVLDYVPMEVLDYPDEDR